MPDKIPIENLLIDSGYLTRSQLDRAMRLKQGRPECSIEEILDRVRLCYKGTADLCSCPGTIWRWRLLAPLKADRKSAAVIEPSFAVRNQFFHEFEEECLIVAATIRCLPMCWMRWKPCRYEGQGSAGAGEGTGSRRLKALWFRTGARIRRESICFNGEARWELARLRKPLFQSWPSWNGWKALCGTHGQHGHRGGLP